MSFIQQYCRAMEDGKELPADFRLQRQSPDKARYSHHVSAYRKCDEGERKPNKSSFTRKCRTKQPDERPPLEPERLDSVLGNDEVAGMSLSAMLAKLLGSTKAQSAAPRGRGDWLDTPGGKRWEAVGEVVYDALEGANVNVHKRRIVMSDGTKLTINQVARNLADTISCDALREHVLLWLEEAGDSDDEERDDGVDVEGEIARWVDDARRANKSAR